MKKIAFALVGAPDGGTQTSSQDDAIKSWLKSLGF